VRKAFDLPPSQISVISDGVDCDAFRPMGLDREPNSVLFVGNSEEYSKGMPYLLEALALLRGRRDVHLTVVDQPLGDLVARTGREQGLAVTITGRVSRDELVRLYNRAQLVVSPSLFEGFGLPAAEAMACETPVVATTAGAFPEVIEDGVSGLLVHPGDSAALAEAIDGLLGDERRLRAFGKQARRRILQRFTWAETARRTVALYEDVLETRRKAGVRANGHATRERVAAGSLSR
jgi:glycosyltransferase involved in cell wall biosynthesis